MGGGECVQRDKSVAEQAITGDDTAFIKIINTYKIDLYKTALSYLGNEERALEAIQEVTYRAYKNISNVKETRYLKTWLIRIMINYCIDQLKINKRYTKSDDVLEAEGIPDNYARIELENAMENIDDQSREIITLMYFHDLKIKEIAQAMQRPEGTIKTWLNKALQLLRSELKEKGGD